MCSKEERISSPLKEGSQTGKNMMREAREPGDMTRSTTQSGGMTRSTTQLGDTTRLMKQTGGQTSISDRNVGMLYIEQEESQTAKTMTGLNTQSEGKTKSTTQLGDAMRLMEQVSLVGMFGMKLEKEGRPSMTT